VRDTLPPHLGEIEVAAYVDRALEPLERERAEAHLDACSDCRQAVVDVWRMSQSSDAPVAESTRGVAAIPARSWLRPVIAAAGILLAASVTIVALKQTGSETAPVVRSLDGTSGIPAVSSISPDDGAAVERDNLVLKWSAHPPGLFRVALLDSAGAPVLVEETNDTTFVVPSSIDLQPGATYFWRVDVLADGITASTSASRFSVTR